MRGIMCLSVLYIFQFAEVKAEGEAKMNPVKFFINQQSKHISYPIMDRF